MTTQATAARPIQISVVLDSGVFLDLVEAENYPDCRVGYFAPEFMIYRDGELIPPTAPAEPNAHAHIPSPLTGSREILFRLIAADGNEKREGVTLSKAFRERLLYRIDLYQGEPFSPPVNEASFDWIFTFTSGFFRSSSVKDRYFKQCDGSTYEPNNKRKMLKKIAHDVVVHFDLEQDERLEIVVEGKVFWNSSDYKDSVEKRFDIEVICPHATAEKYYRDALDFRGNDYWLPNQGDPGPMGGRP